MEQQQNNNNIKNIIEEMPQPNIDKIKMKCLKKIDKILSKDNLTSEDIETLRELNNTLKCCCENGKERKENLVFTNTKEEGEALISGYMGNYNFLDYHYLRLFSLAKLIKLLLSEEVIKW